MVQYKVDTGIEGEVISFELREGRYQRETGNTRVAPPVTTTADGQVAAMEPLNERDEAALRVLEQLQRTFCFMQFSKRRYYDPRSFVDACKTLNLNFNVYHQNDAAEFCDQLLDRIENATQGKQTNQNVWNDVIQKQIFGGKSLYQKIPQGCEAYNTDKQECGHWQSSRLESFLKIELLIRGKDKIDDSLAEMIIGELMDGDNKVDCDVCAKKKATIRRTCIGKLPNTMVLHLKRFDLDFQTFETVKLNNRMAFSTRLNMLKYTKEGIEAEERKEQRAAAQALREENADAEEGTRRSTDGGIAYEAPPTGEAELDALDFEYELQGVLVHAGIAQGGHYYSFICDTDTANAPATLDLNESMNSSEKRWYRFEDEDVSHFSPDQIAPQCFGGPAFNGTQSGEEDRTSNALMLFFNKVRPSDVNEEGPEATLTSPSPEEDNPKGDKPKATEIKGSPSQLDTLPGGLLVNGYQAFGREVRESNLNHVLSCYVLDTDLHGFVRGLISSISSSAAKKPTPAGMPVTILSLYSI
jgi:ubiquitin carboxyl-terminal hydrolase 9/24